MFESFVGYFTFDCLSELGNVRVISLVCTLMGVLSQLGMFESFASCVLITSSHMYIGPCTFVYLQS